MGIASMDIASDVEGLESAKQNLQIVQKRLMVREAFVYESFASRRLKEILKVPLPAGPRWAWMLQGIETAEDTLPKQPGGRVASGSGQAALQVPWSVEACLGLTLVLDCHDYPHQGWLLKLELARALLRP
ncbi:unnamed protein product [Effrenium voratum]|uniref:Uncharacterized protein n=1 Tax=Effrenium voratum TaxID=2562239 RepID=A0AA36IKJ5_9DINO|nr:unnamed protein product [Effrenium voratum]CAJ1461979.1 unnamed protein product [Effrenium voratum]